MNADAAVAEPANPVQPVTPTGSKQAGSKPASSKPMVRHERIRELREAQHLTLKQAEALAGIGRNSWGAIESGRYCINAKRGGIHVGTLVNIARVLGCHPMDLLNLPEFSSPVKTVTAVTAVTAAARPAVASSSTADVPGQLTIEAVAGEAVPADGELAGRAACEAGKPPTANPYRRGTRESGEWNRGYIAQRARLVAALRISRVRMPKHKGGTRAATSPNS